MKKITTKFIMENSPCIAYPKSRVSKLIGSGKTLLQILALKIKPQDRIWVMTRSGVLTHAEIVEFAIDCAERALPEFEKQFPYDKRLRNAINAAKAWLENPTAYAANAAANATYAAANATYAAANAATNAAAYAAAYAANAANAAAYAAAYAANAAAYTAAYAAANAAAAEYAAEYDHQIEFLSNIIKRRAK